LAELTPLCRASFPSFRWPSISGTSTCGYKLKVQIIDFPGGMPGDIGMSLSWG